MTLDKPCRARCRPPRPNPLQAFAEPQKTMLPDVKSKGRGGLLSALQLAWAGGRRK